MRSGSAWGWVELSLAGLSLAGLSLAGLSLVGCSGCQAPLGLGRQAALVALTDGGAAARLVTVGGSGRGRQDGVLRGAPGGPRGQPGQSGPLALVHAEHWLGLDRDGDGVRDLEDADAGLRVGTGLDGDGDGDPKEASLRLPKGLARCPDGDLWIADSGNRALKRLHAGRVERMARAGDGGPLVHPRGLACADDGTLWVADFGGGALLRRGTDGALTVAAELSDEDDPTRPDTATDPAAPYVVALWPDGRVLVGETAGLVAYDPRTQRLTRVPLHAGPDATLFSGRASGLAVDAAGHRGWVSLPLRRQIGEVTERPDGGLWLASGPQPFASPLALAYLPERGRLLVSSGITPGLAEYDPATGDAVQWAAGATTGAPVRPPPPPPLPTARFDSPSRLATDGDALWVLEADGALRHVDAQGRVTSHPLGLTAAGSVALAVRGEGRWAASGTRLVPFDAQGKPGVAEPLDGDVGGLALADDGALWRSDLTRHRLLRRASPGAPWTPVSALDAPGALAPGTGGAIWAIDHGRALWKVAADGVATAVVDHRARPSSGDGALDDPTVGLEQVADLVVLGPDRFLLADGHRVRMLAGGQLLTAVGKFDACDADGFGVGAHLNHPTGLVQRGDGFWVADRDNHRLRRVTLP